MDKNKALQEYIRTKLTCHFWTPEQIAGRLKKYEDVLPYVSHQTIYAWIYKKEQKDEKLWTFLPRHKATRGLRKSKTRLAAAFKTAFRFMIDQLLSHNLGLSKAI